MGLSEYMLYEGIPVVHKIVRDGINAHIILFGAQDDDAILSPMGFYSRKKASLTFLSLAGKSGFEMGYVEETIRNYFVISSYQKLFKSSLSCI